MSCCNKKKEDLPLKEINARLEFLKTRTTQINSIGGGISTQCEPHFKTTGKVETKEGFVFINNVEAGEAPYDIKIRCFHPKDIFPKVLDQVKVNNEFLINVLSVTPVNLNNRIVDIKGKIIERLPKN